MTEAGWTGSRRLLRRIREVMAAAGDAAARLDAVVRLIAADTMADVCSCYVLRAGEVLELFATEGLRAEAVHRTRMRVGEGVIGDVAAYARPLVLEDAWSYPNFSYKPETGEELYRSMMGVPILRNGKVIGVLALQHRDSRTYAEEEVEALETVAMVLAELIASGQLVDPSEATSTEDVVKPRRFDGVTLNAGLAIGTAVLHRPRVVIHQMVAEDPTSELARLAAAVTSVQERLDKLLAADDLKAAGEAREVLETFRLFAGDRGWMGRMREAILGGLTAEAAAQKVQNDMRARLREATDPYLRERLIDLEDLTTRLLVELAGAERPGPLPDDAVLFARNLGPAELLDYDRTRLKAVVLEEGSATAHVAIVARALDVPMLGKVRDALLHVDDGDPVVVDAANAQVFLRPADEVRAQVRAAMVARAEQTQRYAALADRPAITRDGRAITLLLNCGLLLDAANVAATRADGIGLYRTEIAFMVRAAYPDVASQTSLYTRIHEVVGGKPVVFRTLDVGGDKTLPYLHADPEENPALGWRAIRIGLDRPAMLRQQLRAMVRASAGRTLQVMFPMIAEVREFERARRLLDLELRDAAAAGVTPPSDVKVGCMVEVPALLFQLPALIRQVDFLSVGSNDLTQFLYAADRGNPMLGDRYDSLAAAMVAALRTLIETAAAANKPLTVCGEMAGRPIEALALLGLGCARLSMSAAAIGPIRALVLDTDTRDIDRLLHQWDGAPAGRLRRVLSDYMRDRGLGR